MFSRRFLICTALLIVCALFAVPAGAQMLTGVQPQSTSSGPSVTGIEQQGFFLTAPMMVDGAKVFTIATFAANPESMMRRYLTVQAAIGTVLSESLDGKPVYDPRNFKVVVMDEGGQAVLAALDQPQRILPIVTVTQTDAEYQHATIHAVALEWQAALQSALLAALVRRQPEFIQQHARAATIGIIVLATITLLAGLVLWLARKHKKIERVTEVALRVLALVWLLYIMYTLLLFPQTSVWGHFVLDAARRTAVIWITAFLFNALIGYVIVRSTYVYARHGRDGNHGRYLLRAPTIRTALNDFKRYVIIFVASLATISALQIPLGSLLAIGGIAAVAVGFAGQSLMRDWINGLAVLAEDQYAVGDYVMIGDYSGIVENLSLRVVQIRDSHGHLISISHSAVTSVVNASRDWSRVDYRIAVDVAANVERAIACLRTAVKELAHDERCKGAIIEGSEFVGVHSISKAGVLLRASIRTQPMRHFAIRQILNERVLETFNAAAIDLGTDPSTPSAPSPNASLRPL